MNVSLTPELEEFINQRVASGKYTTASEVVREALRMMSDAEEFRQMKLEKLKKEIAIGLEQLKRGERVTMEEVMKEIRKKSEDRKAAIK